MTRCHLDLPCARSTKRSQTIAYRRTSWATPSCNPPTKTGLQSLSSTLQSPLVARLTLCLDLLLIELYQSVDRATEMSRDSTLSDWQNTGTSSPASAHLKENPRSAWSLTPLLWSMHLVAYYSHPETGWRLNSTRWQNQTSFLLTPSLSESNDSCSLLAMMNMWKLRVTVTKTASLKQQKKNTYIMNINALDTLF